MWKPRAQCDLTKLCEILGEIYNELDLGTRAYYFDALRRFALLAESDRPIVSTGCFSDFECLVMSIFYEVV